jgi:hypothetical protein
LIAGRLAPASATPRPRASSDQRRLVTIRD